MVFKKVSIMEVSNKFVTRQDVRARTGWSLVFIDRHLPRIKIGRKVLIPVDALERLLTEGQINAAA